MEEHHRYKAITYRLYPNATTTRKLESTLGCCCDLYNMLLEDELTYYTSEGAKRSKFDLNRRMTEISNAHPEIKKEAYSTCRQNVTDRVHRAMKGCRPDKTGRLTHVPRFRSRNRYDSFCYGFPQGFAFKGDRLHLSKIGDIRFRHDYHPRGEMRTCTVHRDAKGKWYAVIVYRMEILGYVKTDLQLSDRTYQCECCGMVMDRDRNAAINILRRGLNTQTLRSAVNGRLCRPRWKETVCGHESHQHAGPLAL